MAVQMRVRPFEVLAPSPQQGHVPCTADASAIRIDRIGGHGVLRPVAFDDQRPAVVQVPVPEHPVHVFDPVHHVSGRASRFLQERHIRSTFAGHLHQFAPRLLALPDVPAHDLDHPTTSASALSPRRLGRVFRGWIYVRCCLPRNTDPKNSPDSFHEPGAATAP